MGTDPGARIVVITGASSGIGRAAALELHRRGARVVTIGRTRERVESVAAEVGSEPYVADFARLDDVRSLAESLLRDHPRIDVLAHNAGLMSPERVVTDDGHELTWQANYLAPFLLQLLLARRLTESHARVVVTTSVAHQIGGVDLSDPSRLDRPYSSFRAYCNSKVALLLFAREIARRSGTDGITASAFHPGFVKTNITEPTGIGPTWLAFASRHLLPLTSPEAGSAALVQLATVDDAPSINGRYYTPKGAPRAMSSRLSRDATLGQALWRLSEHTVRPQLSRLA